MNLLIISYAICFTKFKHPKLLSSDNESSAQSEAQDPKIKNLYSVATQRSSTPNMKIIIFHELVDRFSHRPRFPAAPRANYRRFAIRHHRGSKKFTHPTPTSDRCTPASLSLEHFYKNAETDRDRPARTHRTTASPVPFVSFPLFTRRRGRHPVGAATARTQNIDHRKKSHRITVISRN